MLASDSQLPTTVYRLPTTTLKGSSRKTCKTSRIMSCDGRKTVGRQSEERKTLKSTATNPRLFARKACQDGAFGAGEGSLILRSAACFSGKPASARHEFPVHCPKAVA